jgi:hypothetical protein
MKTTIRWDTMKWSLVQVYRSFEVIYCLHLQGWKVSNKSQQEISFLFKPEDVKSLFFWNFGIFLNSCACLVGLSFDLEDWYSTFFETPENFYETARRRIAEDTCTRKHRRKAPLSEIRTHIRSVWASEDNWYLTPCSHCDRRGNNHL